jgi:hypothetical protein
MRILLLLAFFFVHAAPLPPGVAYNPESGECGSYFGGDEYGGYVLPDPWVVTYDAEISTGNYDVGVQAYCEQLGYTYVPGNMGQIYGTHQRSSLYYLRVITKYAPVCCISAILLIGVGIVILWRYKKKKKAVTETSP